MKNYIAPLIILAASLTFNATASAGVLVLGDNEAAACYRTVLHGNTGSRGALKKCSNALKEPLTKRDLAATYINRGILYMRKGNFETAKVDMEAALDVGQNIPEAHINYSGIQFYLGDYDGALLTVNNVINDMQTTKMPQALYNRSLIHHRSGNYKSAYFDLKKALELKPDWKLAQDAISQYDVRPAKAGT